MLGRQASIQYPTMFRIMARRKPGARNVNRPVMISDVVIVIIVGADEDDEEVWNGDEIHSVDVWIMSNDIS